VEISLPPLSKENVSVSDCFPAISVFSTRRPRRSYLNWRVKDQGHHKKLTIDGEDPILGNAILIGLSSNRVPNKEQGLPALYYILIILSIKSNL
jgi:hypothetical protein